jgi:hypothetical protein
MKTDAMNNTLITNTGTGPLKPTEKKNKDENQVIKN